MKYLPLFLILVGCAAEPVVQQTQPRRKECGNRHFDAPLMLACAACYSGIKPHGKGWEWPPLNELNQRVNTHLRLEGALIMSVCPRCSAKRIGGNK